MNRIIISLLVIITFFTRCKNANKAEGEFLVQHSEFVIPDERNNLDTSLADKLNLWFEKNSSYDTISGYELCYTVEFFSDKWFDHDLGNDTIVILSYYVPLHNYHGYKGVFYFNKNNIAIIDRNNIGEKFYNKQILENIPLNTFRPGWTVCNLPVMELLKLENGNFVKKHKFDR